MQFPDNHHHFLSRGWGLADPSTTDMTYTGTHLLPLHLRDAGFVLEMGNQNICGDEDAVSRNSGWSATLSHPGRVYGGVRIDCLLVVISPPLHCNLAAQPNVIKMILEEAERLATLAITGAAVPFNLQDIT